MDAIAFAASGLVGARAKLDRLVEEAVAAIDASGLAAAGDFLREAAHSWRSGEAETLSGVFATTLRA